MRTQILKINGVQPEQLAQLHHFLGIENVGVNGITLDKVPEGVNVEEVDYDSTQGGPNVRLLKSEYNPKFETYTIELQVPISVGMDASGTRHKLDPNAVVMASRRIVDGIYDALEIFPEEECIGFDFSRRPGTK